MLVLIQNSFLLKKSRTPTKVVLVLKLVMESFLRTYVEKSIEFLMDIAYTVPERREDTV